MRDESIGAYQANLGAILAQGRAEEARNHTLQVAIRAIFIQMGATSHVNELDGKTRELFRDLRGMLTVYMKGVD